MPAENVHAKPAALSWEQAAAFPLAGLTAWRAVVTCAGPRPAGALLITGGGSGVSTFCMQIARALGADVWVTSGDDARSRAASSSARAGASATTIRNGRSRSSPRAAARACTLSSTRSAAEGWAQALAALVRGGVLVNYGDTGGDESTIPVAEIYWQWRSLVGTTMGSPREFHALCEHVAVSSWRPASTRCTSWPTLRSRPGA